MQNSIAVRIADFLKGYLPFSLLPMSQLEALAANVIVSYHEGGEILFNKHDSVKAYFFVVKEGAIHLQSHKDGTSELIDTCDEGDCLGVRPLLGGGQYTLSAEVAESSLLYAIPVEAFLPIMEEYPSINYYLSRQLAAEVHLSFSQDHHQYLMNPKSFSLQKGNDDLREVQNIIQDRAPVICTAQTTIQNAALLMKAEKVSSIIAINKERCPIGIITDKDLRTKVATGEVLITEELQRIMTKPVITIKPNLSVAEIQIQMIKNKVHHLVITGDGTDQSPTIGVITEHDLLVMQANNPAVLIRRIGKCQTTPELANIRQIAEGLLEKYLHQEVGIRFISEVISSINDAIIIRSIELSESELKKEGIPNQDWKFAWLSLGSEGRQEQLLKTDQDSALVFEDVPLDQKEACKTYFLSLANKVTQKLKRCGFDYCPAEMMANNPKWCLSLSDWKTQFSKWLLQPTPKAVLFSTIFFDFRPVFGETGLAGALTDFIFDKIDDRTPFLTFLAKNALQNPPPLSFFRNFVVEKNGDHAEKFDIKARAMMPLTDAARLLMLASKTGQVNNTFKRFTALAQLEPKQAALFQQAADAYEILMRLRAKHGLTQKDSGRYIDPNKLTKMERLSLRNAFRPIAELQTLISTRFNLAILM